MSRAKYTIHAIHCDTPRCDEVFEGHAGEPAGSVAMQAKAKGWQWHAETNGDHCPEHHQESA